MHENSYFAQRGMEIRDTEEKRPHLGILRMETALTGVSVSARTVRRLFTLIPQIFTKCNNKFKNQFSTNNRKSNFHILKGRR